MDFMRAGLFPDDSVIRRVNRENVLLLGGGRALLMQLAHPMVAAGVDEHSDFRIRPMYRLRRTIRMVMAIVFGDRDTALAAARSVNRVHGRVVGDGYRALDPDLLMWVHATLVDTVLLTYETFVRRLGADDREVFYQEMKVLGELLGIPRDRFPDRHLDFQRYVEGMIAGGAVTVGPQALDLARLVLRLRLLRLPGTASIAWEVITAALLRAEVGGDALGVFLRLGVHHGDLLDRLLRAEELDHARDRPRAGAHTVDRFDLGVLGHQQKRLEIEHRADHCLGAAEAPTHLQVAKCVEKGEHAALRHAQIDCPGGLFEGGALRRDAAEERDRHRDRLAVDDVDLESLHRLGAHTSCLRGRGKSRADVDRDASVVVLREAAVDLGELAG